MANKYGKNGEAVAAFLEEVAATDLDGWRAFLDLEWPSPELTAAGRAMNKVPMSASVNSAVDGACLRTLRGLGNIDRLMGASTIASRVEAAAKTLAVGDALAPEHLRVILEPFAAARVPVRGRPRHRAHRAVGRSRRRTPASAT